RLPALQTRIATLDAQLTSTTRRLLERRQAAFRRAVETLQAVSPLATLSRGYAIVQREAEPHANQAAPDAETASPAAQSPIVRRASELTPGERIRARLAEGSVEAIVDKVHPPDP
ncbi:MAG: exodeoxyribonuclease VII large subunit, partial [Pseudomonadota bacterium]